MSLHEADNRGMKEWYLDGYIRYGSTVMYVERIPCEVLSIGGYEDTDWHSVGSSIWIQSWYSHRIGIWYCLKQPAPEYRPYHDAFLWIADLGKHLVDYLHHHDKTKLLHFKEDFNSWIRKIHGMDDIFRQWLRRYADTDFRRVVAAYASFLYSQAVQLGEKYTEHPLWGEIDPTTMDAVPRQSEQVKRPIALNRDAKYQELKTTTIVTPYVYRCFKQLPWAKFLRVQESKSSTLPKKLARPSRTDFDSPSHNEDSVPTDLTSAYNAVDDLSRSSSQHREMILVGDVIVVRSDEHTDWKSNDSSWYGYVQETSQQKNGLKLSLLWLYRPSDTPCQNMHYPLSNELFLSDHCNCGDEPIYAEEVVSKLRVAFYGHHNTPNTDYFIRQKYIERDGAWATLSRSDFTCICKKPKRQPILQCGDTWLVTNQFSKSKKTLEPVVVLSNDDTTATVRRLKRLGRDYEFQNADANELVYSSDIHTISRVALSRPCHVRFYTTEQKKNRRIPAPYSRGGTGDFFFVSHWDDGALQAVQKVYPTWLNQGFDPSISSCSAMKGLDIFCGGGSLGRGLEEGGAVEMKWAVDYCCEAIHTYNANVQDQARVKLFYGSVNDYLSNAMRGSKSSMIAQRGEVDFIAAGSPCQGFSIINNNRHKDASLVNVSMVASVVSFVDFYRPKYALLENVLGMAKCDPKNQESNVFAQVVCALVGMGYQVRPFLLDAWNFGAPQSRTRLFISIAAPGLTPLPDPRQSHSHPAGVKARALGKTANGLPLGTRYWGTTTFDYITIKEATRDLPLNQHGRLPSIAYPDHRLVRYVRPLDQGRIECVPKFPVAMNFIKAVELGVMAEPQIESHSWESIIRSSKKSKSWQRVIPDALIATVTTAITPEDGIAGHWVHWEADRTMTIMEARRAQGFPDYEVIVGSPPLQWKIIGNSVARPVRLALGLALRTAWQANIEATASGLVQAATDKMDAFSDVEAPTDEEMVDTNDVMAEESLLREPQTSAPKKGLTRAEIAHHKSTSSSSNLTHRPKSRILQPPALPARTFTKHLRSSTTIGELLVLPKNRRGPRAKPQQSPLPQSNTIDSVIEISSDEEIPSRDASQSTANESQMDIGDESII